MEKIYMPMFRGRKRTQIFFDENSNMNDIVSTIQQRIDKGYTVIKLAKEPNLGHGPYILPDTEKGKWCIFLQEPRKLVHLFAWAQGKVLTMFPELKKKAHPLFII